MTAPEPSPRPAAETDTRGGEPRQALAERIAAGSQRLYDRDFLGRLWVAEYVSDVDTLLLALEDRQPTAAPRLGDAQGMAAALMDQWHYLEHVRPRRLNEAASPPTAAAGDER